MKFVLKYLNFLCCPSSYQKILQNFALVWVKATEANLQHISLEVKSSGRSLIFIYRAVLDRSTYTQKSHIGFSRDWNNFGKLLFIVVFKFKKLKRRKWETKVSSKIIDCLNRISFTEKKFEVQTVQKMLKKNDSFSCYLYYTCFESIFTYYLSKKD